MDVRRATSTDTMLAYAALKRAAAPRPAETEERFEGAASTLPSRRRIADSMMGELLAAQGQEHARRPTKGKPKPPETPPPETAPPVAAPVEAGSDAIATPAIVEMVRQQLAERSPLRAAAANTDAYLAAAKVQHANAVKLASLRSVMAGQAALTLLVTGQAHLRAMQDQRPLVSLFA